MYASDCEELIGYQSSSAQEWHMMPPWLSDSTARNHCPAGQFQGRPELRTALYIIVTMIITRKYQKKCCPKCGQISTNLITDSLFKKCFGST